MTSLYSGLSTMTDYFSGKGVGGLTERKGWLLSEGGWLLGMLSPLLLLDLRMEFFVKCKNTRIASLI